MPKGEDSYDVETRFGYVRGVIFDSEFYNIEEGASCKLQQLVNSWRGGADISAACKHCGLGVKVVGPGNRR